jgi:alanine dehydrogenase
MQEHRVGLVPHAVATLVAHGHQVTVETGAGENARYTDLEYAEAGAQLVNSAEQVFASELIIKTAPPTLDEIDWMQPNQVLISPIHLPILQEAYIKKLQKKRVIALAMEYIRDDETGMYPIVHVMSEISGINAILIASELLATGRGGKGVLLGGIAGVPPAKVIILGAGVVAEFATRTALGLGAEVRLHTSVINPAHLREQLITADVAIGAIHSPEGRVPMIVSAEIVSQMKPGSVIIDVSIDQGGCFETAKMTTHLEPSYTQHGVVHYCVPNIPSRVAQTASNAISNILTSLLLKAETGGMHHLITSNEGLRKGVYTYRGSLTNAYLGSIFQIKSTNLDLLITSDF